MKVQPKTAQPTSNTNTNNNTGNNPPQEAPPASQSASSEPSDAVTLSDEARESQAEDSVAQDPDSNPAHHDPQDPQGPQEPEEGKEQGPVDRPYPSQEEVDEALAEYEETGDPSALDEVDVFRENLPPELQEEYDRQLAELREDERIQFDYVDGAEPNPGTEDLVLRGILASTFGRPAELDRALDYAVEVDGSFNVEVSGEFDLNGEEEGTPIGYANRDGDIELSEEGFLQSITYGGNVALHEFSHALQLGGDPDQNPESNFSDFSILPPGVDEEGYQEFEELFFDAYDPEGDQAEDTVHYFTRVQEDFHLDPEGLRERSPELYDWMVEYSNYDPLTGEVDRRDIAVENVQVAVDDFLDNLFSWAA